MTAKEIVDRIEAGEAPRPLLRRAPSGIAEAYFERVRVACAADPACAARLARHWHALLQHGDDPGLAYRTKGVADRMAGRWLASARAFIQAGDSAEGAREKLSYAIGGVDGLAKAARVDEAVALGTRLAEGLDALDEPALAARARLNAANALLAAERGLEARLLYARVIPAFRASALAMEEAMARLGLSTTHVYGGDPAIATEEAAQGRDLARAEELDYLAALCEMNLAHVAIVSGRADEAFAALRALRSRVEGNPSDAARLEESIGDACLRLNLLDEAAEAYGVALAAADALPAVDRAHVRLGLGEALVSKRPEVAHAYLIQAQRGYRRLGNPHWRAAATATRAELRAGSREALTLAREAVAESLGSPYHECLARLALAQARVREGESPLADLDRVERLVRRYGFRRFAWRVHALRAAVSDRPLSHYRKMLVEILRDRLATRSVAARAGFLRDKSEALGEYLALLLSEPTPRRVAEARDAIRRTRAVTLLDEILRGGEFEHDVERRERLEALRAEIVRESSGDAAPDARGSLAIAVPQRRAWTEATHVLGVLDDVMPDTIVEGCVVLAEAGGRLWAILDGRVFPLGLSVSELEDALRWLQFELEVPTARRDAPACEATAILRELSEALVAPWLERASKPLRLCPDGLLWRVPWDAILPDGWGAVLLLHPSLRGGHSVGALRKVAVWIDTPADLPNAESEARMVLACFPEARLMRTRAEILDSLEEDWDLVHVVGHARHNPGNAMFSALEFPDGPIYATEVARSRLRARLVCLSACETGVLSADTPEEPDGLVRAFLARGAHSVLASLWPLDDEAAARFFSVLYSEIVPSKDLVTAVGAARDAVRAWHDHPYFWASLSLFGGYQR